MDSEISFIQGDACVRSDLEKCGTDFEAIIHFAGTSSAPMFTNDPSSPKSEDDNELRRDKEDSNFVWGYENAVKSFVQVLDFAADIGAKKVLYASTSSLYGNNPMPLTEDQKVTPPNHYAVTKFLYENCARCFCQVHKDIDVVGFRFMSIYGPNEEAKGQYANMISQFLWDIARDRPPVIYGDGTQFRDFTNVVDVVQALTKTIEFLEPLGAKVFNIGRGESTSFNDIFAQINEALGKNVVPIFIPNPVKEMYVAGQHADISKIQKKLGFNPTMDLEKGIAQLVDQLDLSRLRDTSSDLWKKSHPDKF
ncbi:NAD-dependent epimerase/dehydratase family protein [Candidatus Gracilibacteria bacterium]|nr:NAD-dependent epimerase/dehydratase family protein [Candidatus Gracilibacteria bacterium]